MRESAPQRLALQYRRIVDDKAFDELETIFTPDAVMAAANFESNGMTEFRVQLLPHQENPAAFLNLLPRLSLDHPPHNRQVEDGRPLPFKSFWGIRNFLVESMRYPFWPSHEKYTVTTARNHHATRRTRQPVAKPPPPSPSTTSPASSRQVRRV